MPVPTVFARGNDSRPGDAPESAQLSFPWITSAGLRHRINCAELRIGQLNPTMRGELALVITQLRQELERRRS